MPVSAEYLTKVFEDAISVLPCNTEAILIIYPADGQGNKKLCYASTVPPRKVADACGRIFDGLGNAE